MDMNSLSHTKWNCKYHIVFAPKFRRRIIFGRLKHDIASILSMLCKRKEVRIVEAEIYIKCHEVFKEEMKKRPTLGEKEIRISFSFIEKMAEGYLHCASINEKDGLDILPCNNDRTSSLCDNNCINGDKYIIINDNVRQKCLYRAVRVNWIKPIVEMYNNDDSRVKYWEKKHRTNKRVRYFLRYQEDEIDYLVVFEESGENVRLITAYPIFFLSMKEDCDKAYEKYIKNIDISE